MGDLTSHFSRHEFACRCGCGFDTVDIILADLCELARIIAGEYPVKVRSGCRCPTHNQAVGGSALSQHMYGRAADLEVRNPKEVYEELCYRFPARYGFGLYSDFIHIDSRTNGPSRWERM